MIRQLKLSKGLKKMLKPSLGSDASSVYDEIESGRSKLMQFSDSLIGVIRFEGRQMVVVAVAGKGLFQARQSIIDMAVANGSVSIRFHTRNGERLLKGVRGLPLTLIEVRKSFLRRPEYVYLLEVM